MPVVLRASCDGGQSALSGAGLEKARWAILSNWMVRVAGSTMLTKVPRTFEPDSMMTPKTWSTWTTEPSSRNTVMSKLAEQFGWTE